LIILFVLAHFGHHLVAALLQPLSPYISTAFNLNYTQMSWLFSAYNLSYGISQLPAGWLADRLSRRILLLVGISGVALCGLFIGLSYSYVLVVAFVILLGILGGGYHPSSSPLISASTIPQYRGRALGFHQIGGTASFFLSPLIAVGIAGLLDWRGSFIATAIPVIVFGIVFYFLLGKRKYSQEALEFPKDSKSEEKAVARNLKHLIPFIVLGAVIQAFIYSTISFIPLYAVDYLKQSTGIGALLFSLFHFAGLFAGPLGGYLSDRIGKVPIMLTSALLAGPLLYLLSIVSYGWGIYLVLMSIGICMYVAMPISEAFIISRVSARNRSTVLGIYYFASRGGPGIIMPFMGTLIDNHSFDMAFTVTAVILTAVSLICTPFLWKTRN